jgi:hypothetical protein
MVCALVPYQARTGRPEIDRELPTIDTGNEGIWHIVSKQPSGVRAVAVRRKSVDLIDRHTGPLNWKPPSGWMTGAACVAAQKAAFLRVETVNRTYVALLSRAS